MRAFFTSLVAFFLSLFAGSLVAQQLAVTTGAGEEYILVFMGVVVLSIVIGLVFFIAQFGSEARRMVDAAARWSLIVFVVLAVVLAAVEYWAVSGDMTKYRADLPIMAGLVLPGLAIILVDWLFVRWRVGRRAVALEGYGRR